MARISVYQITVPEYTVKTKPDWNVIGTKIDKIIKKHFLGKEVVIRCLTISEHPSKSVEDIVNIIRKRGTDRYDPEREGDRYDNIEGKHIDFFALPFTIREHTKIMENFIEPFYLTGKRYGERNRVDIAILYDRTKVKRVIHTYSDGRRKHDGYIFKDQENKKDALLGILKILP